MRTLFVFIHSAVTTSLLSAGLLAMLGGQAQAACLPGGCHQNGLVFREASNNFKITDVTGAGTREQPFVVYQDVWGLDISLEISGLAGMGQYLVFNRPGLAISIVSRNLTNAFWRFYDHELQETVGVSSSENDGLSFAQGIGPARPYTSDRYAQADEITDIRDFINFYRGDGVDSGESVRFNYVITDTIPNQRFYIRQRPDYRTNTVPTAVVQQLAKLSNAGGQEPKPKPIQPLLPQLQPSPVNVSPSTGAIAPVPEPTGAIVGALAILGGRLLNLKQKTSPSKS